MENRWIRGGTQQFPSGSKGALAISATIACSTAVRAIRDSLRDAAHVRSASLRIIPAPRDNNGLPSKLRIIPLLHGCIKCIHIDMNDLASGHLPTILLRRPDQCERLPICPAFGFLGARCREACEHAWTRYPGRSVIHRAYGVSISAEATGGSRTNYRRCANQGRQRRHRSYILG
jgi:hypothetical protein